MGQGISAILTFAIGVAISPVPIIAVTLMLFSQRARVNGPVFAVGWAVALAVVSGVAYVLADQGDASTSDTATTTLAWGKIAAGVLFLLLAVRTWRRRPAPGEEAPMPGWMAGIDSFTPVRALVLSLLLAGVNPKNLLLSLAAGSVLAQLELPTNQAVASLVVFVLVGSVTIVVPVVYYLVGGAGAKARLDSAKTWLAVHNDAVMAVLFVVFGLDLVAKGLPPLT